MQVSRRQQYDDLPDEEKRSRRRPAAPRYHRPSAEAEALFSKSPDGRIAPAVDAPAVMAKVKWFDLTKGMGFATIIDTGEDLFIPGRVAGYEADLPDGATITVRVGDSDRPGKSRMVTQIVDIDRTTAAPRVPRAPRPPLVASRTVYGRLLSRDTRGFGFLKPDDGSANVYISAKRFAEPAVEDIQVGDPLEADVADADWGCIATSLRRL